MQEYLTGQWDPVCEGLLGWLHVVHVELFPAKELRKRDSFPSLIFLQLQDNTAELFLLFSFSEEKNLPCRSIDCNGVFLVVVVVFVVVAVFFFNSSPGCGSVQFIVLPKP